MTRECGLGEGAWSILAARCGLVGLEAAGQFADRADTLPDEFVADDLPNDFLPNFEGQFLADIFRDGDLPLGGDGGGGGTHEGSIRWRWLLTQGLAPYDSRKRCRRERERRLFHFSPRFVKSVIARDWIDSCRQELASERLAMFFKFLDWERRYYFCSVRPDSPLSELRIFFCCV